MQENQKYFIPPKFSDQFMLFGYTVTEMMVIMGTGLIALRITLNGSPQALLVPAIIAGVCYKPHFWYDGKSFLQGLMMRINYYNSDNMYSLEECRKRWK